MSPDGQWKVNAEFFGKETSPGGHGFSQGALATSCFIVAAIQQGHGRCPVCHAACQPGNGSGAGYYADCNPH